MKIIVLVIFGYLVVSTNAAGGYALDQVSESKAEAVVEENSSQQVSEAEVGDTKEAWSEDAGLEEAGLEDAKPKDASESPTPVAANPLPDVKPTKREKVVVTTKTQATTPQKNAEPEKPSKQSKENSNAQISALDMIPYPMNVILRTFGKDVLKNLDVETMCDTVQLVDWPKYKKLLEAEDFYGFTQKITNDEILNATAEAFQQAASSYINKMVETLSKSIKIDGFDPLQKNLKDLLETISNNIGTPKDKSANAQNNINNYVERIVDKEAQKEALLNLQKNIDKILSVLTSVKAQNSIQVSKKNERSGYNKGSPAA